MIGFLRRPRGALPTAGIVGTTLGVAYGISQWALQSASPAAVDVVTTAPPLIFTPAAEVTLAFADTDRGVCYPLNGTFHGCNIDYSRCEVPEGFYNASASGIDPVLLILLLVVYCTCLHAARRLRNSLLTPERYAVLRASIGHICVGYSSVMSIIAGLASAEDYTGTATVSLLSEDAACWVKLVGTVACSLLSALFSTFLASRGDSDVEKARTKLGWIIKKRNETIAVLVNAVNEWGSSYANLVKLHEATQADLTSKALLLNQAELQRVQNEAELKTLRTASEGKDSKIAELGKKLSEANTSNDVQSEAMKEMQSELDTANAKIAEKSAELDRLQRDMASAESRSGEQSTKMKDLESKLEIEETKSRAQTTQVEELHGQVVAKDTTIYEQSSSFSGLHADMSAINSNFQTKKNDWDAKNDEQQSTITSLTTAKRESNDKLNIRTSELASSKKLCLELQRQLDESANSVFEFFPLRSEDAALSQSFDQRYDANAGKKATTSSSFDSSTGKSSPARVFKFGAESDLQMSFRPQLMREPDAATCQVSSGFGLEPQAGKSLAGPPQSALQPSPSITPRLGDGKLRTRPPQLGSQLSSGTARTAALEKALDGSIKPVASTQTKSQATPPAIVRFTGHAISTPKSKRSRTNRAAYPQPRFDDWVEVGDKDGPSLKLISSDGTEPSRKPHTDASKELSPNQSDQELLAARPDFVSVEVVEGSRDKSTHNSPATSSTTEEESTAPPPLTPDVSPASNVATRVVDDSPLDISSCGSQTGTSGSEEVKSSSKADSAASQSFSPTTPAADIASSTQSLDAPLESASERLPAPTTAATTAAPASAPATKPCYYKPEVGGECKNYAKNTCVGNPDNYDPLTHKWTTVLSGTVRRWGSVDKDEDSTHKTRAKKAKLCSECWVRKQADKAK